MLEGKKNISYVTKIVEKSFNNGIVVSTKTRQGNERKDKISCTTFNNQINEKKEFEANLNLLKRHSPNELGHMLTYYVI